MSDVIIRHPRREDGAALHRLVQACPPLDVNTAYAYFLLCDHFSDSCAVVDGEDGELIAAVTGYRPPKEHGVLFVWQLMVSEAGRGKGLAKGLIRWLLEQPAHRDVTWIHTTIGPDNGASQGVFKSLAKNLHTDITSEAYLTGDVLGEGHEAEDLYKIGPLPGTTPASETTS